MHDNKTEKKNLLIYAHYYIPDTASTGQILRELAEGMLDKFNITVICVVPSYLGTIEDKYKTKKYYEEEINGVKVLRIRVPEFSKTNKKSRVKNIVSYFFGAMGATFKVGNEAEGAYHENAHAAREGQGRRRAGAECACAASGVSHYTRNRNQRKGGSSPHELLPFRLG